MKKKIYINWDNLPIHLDKGIINEIPWLAKYCDIYLITTDTSKKSSIWKEKIALIEEKIGRVGIFYKILTVNNFIILNQCDFFIDIFDSHIEGFHGKLFPVGGTQFPTFGHVVSCLLGYSFVNYQEDDFIKMIAGMEKQENERGKTKEFVNILLSDCILKPIEEKFGKDDYYTNRLANMREIISDALIGYLLDWDGQLMSPRIGYLSKHLDIYRHLIASRFLPEMKCLCCVFGNKINPDNFPSIIALNLGNKFDDTLFNKRALIGMNENSDDVYIESCKLCGKNWIYYYHDGRFGYDLWYRAIIASDELPNLTPENAVKYIESADFYIRGGSYRGRGYDIGKIKEGLGSV